MGDSRRFSGPQFRADEVQEHEAVRTTIVGGRPPGSGQPVGPVPRGVEVLIKKASVDPGFRQVLLEHRAAAADEIGLRLDPAETMMLAAVPQAQLEAIIERTTVPQEHRRAFLGKAAAAMLVALGYAMPAEALAGGVIGSFGVRPDVPGEAAANPNAERMLAKVRFVLADVLERETDGIRFDTKLKADLQMTPAQFDAVEQSLEKGFQIRLSSRKVRESETVGDLIGHIQRIQEVQQAVVDVLRKRLQLDDDVPIAAETSLEHGLKPTPAQLAMVRRDLSQQLRVHLDWNALRQKKTVGDLVELVADAVLLREQNADRPDPPPTRGIQSDMPMSFGIQPDMPSQRLPNQSVRPEQPPPGSFGGVRP